MRRGELDHLEIPEQPLDILAQQIVATVAPEEWTEDALFEMVTRAYPFRNLKREKFRRSHPHAVGRIHHATRPARNLSASRRSQSSHSRRDAARDFRRSPTAARFPTRLTIASFSNRPKHFVGTLNEDFAIESLAGDIFQLGNSSYEIKRVGAGEVRVLDAHGQPPSIPFWLGEAPGRSEELSRVGFALAR